MSGWGGLRVFVVRSPRESSFLLELTLQWCWRPAGRTEARQGLSHIQATVRDRLFPLLVRVQWSC